MLCVFSLYESFRENHQNIHHDLGFRSRYHICLQLNIRRHNHDIAIPNINLTKPFDASYYNLQGAEEIMYIQLCRILQSLVFKNLQEFALDWEHNTLVRMKKNDADTISRGTQTSHSFWVPITSFKSFVFFPQTIISNYPRIQTLARKIQSYGRVSSWEIFIVLPLFQPCLPCISSPHELLHHGHEGGVEFVVVGYMLVGYYV